MPRRKLRPEELTYWGILLFAAILVGYLLVTLIHLSMKEETGFLQTTAIKRGAQFVVVDTSVGVIRIALLRSQAPVSVNNFLSLAESGFYDQTKFHRVVKGLLIQGGDPLSREADRELYGTGGPGYVFSDEIHGQKMERGVVVMVNMGRPKTNGSQFFILIADQAPMMEGRYTIFGKVVEGMSVVDQIGNVPVDERNIPVTPVVIEEIIIE